MLLRSIITEAPVGLDDLKAMKSIIAGKIKGLPEDDDTIKALREIEDLLKHVNAGGKLGIINGKLKSIEDPTVDKEQKRLARYILSLDMTPDQREQLFDLWRNDRLVNRKTLLTKGKHNFAEIINGYNDATNPFIKELVNDLMREATLGQGKGEFGLSALSKSINKQEGKGDLSIGGRAIEVKTTDGGAGRFTDQEVRPGDGFEAQATELNKWLKSQGFNLPVSGLSIGAAVEVYKFLVEQLDTKAQKKFISMLSSVVGLIFNNQVEVKSIIAAVQAGNAGAALQEYAKASFKFYMDNKEDDGVLYINLGTEPITTVYFETADDLTAAKMRLHAGTAYVTSTKDVRLPYPQMDIVDTTFGANAAAKELKKQQAELTRQAKAAPVATPNPLDRKKSGAQFNKEVLAFATNFAHSKKIYDPITITKMTQKVMALIQSGASPNQMKTQLNQMAKEELSR